MSLSSLDNKPKVKNEVCVTGASGFIASHTIEQLLELDYEVRGTVRSLEDTKKYHHLLQFHGAQKRLQLFQADLLDANAFDFVIDGVTTVMHMASPYTLSVDDPKKDLVAPAVEGTLNVLNSCMKYESVKRVVLTSSMAAITDEPGNTILTEKDWNTKSSLTRNPYFYSKTQAERAAWAFMKDNSPHFDLVVINPYVVIGPSFSPRLNESNKIFINLLDGTFPAIFALTFGLVDVRDVAKAHILAMEISGASGRYICAADTLSMREIVDILQDAGFGKDKLPQTRLDHSVGNRLAKLTSYTQPKGVGSFIRSHVGRIPRYSHKKIVSELGVSFRNIHQSMFDTLDDLRRWGHIS